MECSKCEHRKNCKHQCMKLPDGKCRADCSHIERCIALFAGNPKSTSCGFEPIRFHEAAKQA